MSERERMLDGARAPTAGELARWIGARNFARWTRLTRFISETYPGVFEPEWSFGGRKHGWCLRYRKSKSFCTLLPERGRFHIVLVYGAAEREKVKALLPLLTSHAREDYESGVTHPDGKWVRVTVDSQKVLSDVSRLLLLKRRPLAAMR